MPKITAGDTAPDVSFDLNVSTVGATAIRFRAMHLNGTFFQAGDCTMDDAANGVGHYTWNPSPPAGAYRCVIVVTFSTGKIETFPQASRLEYVVKPQVPAA